MIDPFAPLIGRRNIQTIVLLRVAKCASSSLYAALGQRNLLCREEKFLNEKLGKDKKYGGLFSVTHALPDEIFNCFGRGVTNLFSIACCRNPFDRAVSQYAFSRRKGWGSKFGIKDDGTFLEYCEACWKLRKDRSFWPSYNQSDWIYGCLNVSFLLRFEQLQLSWDNMIKEFQIKDLPETLPWENKSEHDDFKKYFCSRSKEIVENLYERDFLKLNYSVEI